MSHQVVFPDDEVYGQDDDDAKAVEEQPAILAFMNHFKTMAQRTSDSNALASLTKTPRGAALVQMIASALGNPGRIDPAVLLKSFLDSVNQPPPADSELDQDLVCALESATNAEELANFRTWMTAELNAGRMTEEETRGVDRACR